MRLNVLNTNDLHAAQCQRWQDMLGTEETERARRYRLEVDRKTFVAGRGMVRELAAGVLGLQVANVSVVSTELGKPYLKGLEQQFQFSISHSSEYLAVLWHQGPEPVGVDIEKLQEDFCYGAVVHHYFSEEERRHINSARDFFLFWTRKEALLKALGTGLVDDLRGVEVMKGEEPLSESDMNLTTLFDERTVISCAISKGLLKPEAHIQSERFILVQ